MTVPDIIIGGPDMGGVFFKSTVIDNSATVQVGDPVTYTAASSSVNSDGSVVLRLAAVTDRILGVVVGFGRANGQAVAFDSGTNDTVTVGSDNETSARIFAYIDITPGAVWSAPITGTIHTTVSFAIGTTCDFGTGASADLIDETTCTTTIYTGNQCIALGPDPDNTARGLIMLSQTFMMAGEET